jgi:hypothetical protein
MQLPRTPPAVRCVLVQDRAVVKPLDPKITLTQLVDC